MKEHISTIHEKQKKFKCDKCGKAYNRPIHLQDHIASVHDGIAPYKCDICSKAFNNKSNFRKHVEKAHVKKESDKFNCGICKKIFSNTRNLKLHLQRFHGNSDQSQNINNGNHGVMNMKCRFCSVELQNEDTLKAHVSQCKMLMNKIETIRQRYAEI